MAKPKKKSKPAAAKKSKPAATKKPARKKPSAPRLDAATRGALLKPGDSLNELVADTLTAWALVKRKVRVPDVSTASLGSLARKAEKAAKRESDLAAKQAAKLAPLSDARMLAADAAYRAALKVKRIADAVAATDQAVADAFASVSERFRTAGAPADTTTKS